MRDLEGRHAVVTGSNTGIGRAIATDLARRGAAVTLACRSEDKTRPVVEAIRHATGNPAVDFLALDLGSLASVRRAAAELVARGQPLHILVNNAGLAGTRGATTADGFEQTFGVNHLGHFLWTDLLLEHLRASAPARIVAVTSSMHFGARGIDWDRLRRPTRSLTGVPEYRVSKLANVLHVAELGRRLAGSGVTTYAAHPGPIASDIYRRLPWPIRQLFLRALRTVEEGAVSSLRAATAPELEAETGGYYHSDGRAREPSALARDPDLAAELWRRSAAMVAG